MKILFPVGSFYPAQVGGHCDAVYYLAQGLASKGHEVMVITTSHGLTEEHNIELDKIIEFKGFKVIYNSSSFLTGFSKLLSSFSVIPKNISKNIISFAPDIVHLSSIFDPISILSGYAAKKEKIPYVWSPHGELAAVAIKEKSFKKKLFLSIPAVKNIILSTSMFHVTSTEESRWLYEFEKKTFSDFLSSNYEIIPNIVDDETFKIEEMNQRLMEKYPSRYILFLGRISKVKNIEALISAYANSKMDPSIKLVIAGWTDEDASYTSKLKQLATGLNLKDRIIFTERNIVGIEKRKLFQNAELFILPSQSENFGMVVVEALAQGTPVISSTGTPWENLEKNNCGYWIDNSVESISKTIEKYLSLSEQERKLMSTNAVKFAQKFSIGNLTEIYIEMYRKVINRS